MNPWKRLVEFEAEWMDGLARAPEKLQRFATVLREIPEAEVGQSEHDVVMDRSTHQLLHYEPPRQRFAEPVLLVYALINRSYILDLQPDRSVVRELLDQGLDVYLINWKNPTLLEAECSLDHYINVWIDDCVRDVLERSTPDRLHLFGYCMGGTMSTCYAAQHPDRLRTLTLLATGFDFSGAGQLAEWAEDYDPEDVTDAYGNVPAEFLSEGFAAMNPISNYLDKYLQLYEHLEDDDFVDNFSRVERWLREGIDVAGRAYVEFIERLYHDNDLIENRFDLDGEPVDLASITMPVLQIMGSYDNLIPPSAGRGFAGEIASVDTKFLEFESGHVGLAISAKAHESLWPPVCEWLSDRSKPA